MTRYQRIMFRHHAQRVGMATAGMCIALAVTFGIGAAFGWC